MSPVIALDIAVVAQKVVGYLFTGDSLNRQVDHIIYRLIWVAVNFWGGKGWVSACHHCRIVPDDEDPKSLAEVTHHLVLVLAKVPRQLPPQPGDGLQAHFVPAAKGVNSQGEEVLVLVLVNKCELFQTSFFSLRAGGLNF